MSIPVTKCIDVCDGMLTRAKPDPDRTNWPALIAVCEGPAGDAARHYIQAACDDVADVRRAHTLLRFIQTHKNISCSVPHPFCVGGIMTSGGADYFTLLSARAASVHWVHARQLSVKTGTLCSKPVMEHLYAARHFSKAAGAWPYDDKLRPWALEPGFATAIEYAIIAAVAEQSASVSEDGGGGALSLAYSACALLAARTTDCRQSASKTAVLLWANTRASSLRASAALIRIDPRPPARHIIATSAQLVLETHTPFLSEAGKRRLSLGVALNGYMRTSATPAEVTDATAAAQSTELQKAVLETAVAQCAASCGKYVAAFDSLDPYGCAITVQSQ